MECETFEDLPELDEEIIRGIPWAENMHQILLRGLNKTFLYWCYIVLKIGVTEEIVDEWVKAFIKTYEETCCCLVNNTAAIRKKTFLEIEELKEELQQLCHTLQINLSEVSNELGSTTLCQEEHDLKKRVNEYKNLVAVKREELNKLHKKQLKLSVLLGREPRIIKDDPLPNAEELESYYKYIEELDLEKFLRLEKYATLKEESIAIAEELKIKPCNKFEKDFLSCDNFVFFITENNMKKLDLLHNSLLKQQKDMKDEIFDLRKKIDDCWNFLDVDLRERENFRQRYGGNSLEVQQALRTELQRCQNLKKDNMKIFVDKLRAELAQLWDKCHCSEISRMRFKSFDTDCYNEDLFAYYEVEIAKWKEYYENNKDLLTLLEKHQNLWNKFSKLEENTTSPNRFKNRGGQLLKEEKERNKLMKQIPQIEKILYDLSDKFKQKHGNYFTTYGTTIGEYLANLHEEKENAKKQKLSARKMQREQTLTTGKYAKNLFVSSSVQVSSTITIKKKCTNLIVNETKKTNGSSKKKNVKINKISVPTIKITSPYDRSKRLSAERKKRIEKIRKLFSQKAKAKIRINELASTSDYNEFEIELSKKKNCRSTLNATEEIESLSTDCKTPTNYKLGPNLQTPKIS